MDRGEVQRWLREGIDAVQQGDRERGRELLLKVVAADEGMEPAWLWLSRAVDDPVDQLVALENALTLNPRNEQALSRAQALRRQLGVAERSPRASAPDAPPPDLPPLSVRAEPARPARRAESPPAPPRGTAVDPDDDPYQCVYCGRPAPEPEDACPHCGRNLLVAGAWAGTGSRNALLILAGLSLQAAILQTLGPFFALAIARGADPTLLVLFGRLPMIDLLFGDYLSWTGNLANAPLAATLAHAFLWLVVLLMLYTDMDAGFLAAVVGALAGLAWAVIGAVVGYLGLIAAGLNAVLHLGVLLLSGAAAVSRSQARVRQLVELDRETFGAAAMYQHGQKYAQQGKWALAAQHWRKAIVLQPTAIQVYKDLAAAQVRLGRYEKALATLETGFERAPGDAQFPRLIEAVRAMLAKP